MDQCADCGAWLPAEDSHREGTPKTPCPKCGSTRRITSSAVHIKGDAELSADAKLIIDWKEVDRLFDEKEYASALLVAAVNVEFILWEILRRFSRTVDPSSLESNIGSMWGQVSNNHPEKLTISSLRKGTEYMSQHHGLVLVGSWKPVVGDIENVRNRIAHERRYFARLTQLKEPDWPEYRIRQVLNDAKAFCHGNAP
jgi:hypothetical protein